MATNIKMSVESRSEKSDPEATIFVTIDTSGSMSGGKIRQVVQSLEKIFNDMPGHVRFVIRTFNTNVKTVVTKKKSYLVFDKLKTNILGHVGSCTALYDAWGQTINEIPYKSSKLDRVFVLIFTDGEDNASKQHSLMSVMKLTEEKIVGNRFFTFIQCGIRSPSVNEIQKLISKQNAKNLKVRCAVHNVEDSVTGIELGFGKARESIRVHFELSLSAAHSRAVSNLSVQLATGDLLGGNANISAVTSSQPSQAVGGRSKMSQLTYPSAQGKKPRDPLKKIEYKIHVTNIPPTAQKKEVLEFFKQWGYCTISHMSTTGISMPQYAEIVFTLESSYKRALKFGNTMFQNYMLKVSPI